MQNGPWYNTTILFRLSGHNSKAYFTTGIKESYGFMCAVNAYGQMNPPWPSNGSSDGYRPLPNSLSTYSLELLGHTIRFIDNWLKCFSANYGSRTGLY